MAKLYGGVETGGTWCVCALGAGPEEIRAHEQFPTTTPEETLERILAFFRSRPAPAAIGIGSFGPIDPDPASPTWGYVTTTPKPGWKGTPVAPVVRDELGVPVVFDTDTSAAAMGEQRWGAGRGDASLCYLTVGTGIGAGFVLDGHPLRGLVHPEAGHIRIPHDHRRDSFAGACPVHGDCWEGLASGTAMAERWNKPAEKLPDDHPAWSLEADYLALGILSIVCIVSPHRVIAGGGVMAHPHLIEAVRDRLRTLNASYLDTPMLGDHIDDYLLPPKLGDNAGVLGALALAQLYD